MSIDITTQYDAEQKKVLVDLWKDIIHQLAHDANPSAIRSFLWRCGVVALDTEWQEVTIGAPNDFVLSQVKKFFATTIKTIIRDVFHQSYKVTYVIHPSFADGEHDLQVDVSALLDIQAPAKQGDVQSQQIRRELSDYFWILFDPSYRFDNLVVGWYNQLAVAAGEAIVQDPGTVYNPFFVYGEVGLGKTHIMQAIANALVKNDPNKVIVYLPTTKFLDHIISAIKKWSLDTLLKKFDDVDVLLLDDIQFIANKDKTQEIFHNIFNDLHLKKKQIVISSDRPPKELDNIADRLKSRFSLGLVADIGTPDFETRSAILRAKADAKWLSLMPAMVDILAKYITGSVREIEGAVTMLSTKHHLYGRQLEIDDMYEVLQTLGYRVDNPADPAVVTPSTRPSMDEVATMVAEYYQIDREEIFGTWRQKQIVRARQMLMYIAHEQYGWTLEHIGDFCGGRHHGTVIHALKSMRKRIQTDEYVKGDYVTLSEKM